MNEIQKFAQFEDDIEFDDCTTLLNEKDKRNLGLRSNFKMCVSSLKIKNHSYNNDYVSLKDLMFEHRFNDVYEILVYVVDNNYLDLPVRLSEFELLSLILIIVMKEL